MSETGLLLAVAASVAALAWLAASDPKRRRVFGFAPVAQRRRRLSIAALVLPGVLLAATGVWAGFVIWLAALTVLGWCLAALSPTRQARLAAALRTGAADLIAAGRRAKTRLQGVLDGSAEAGAALPAEAIERIAALEQRVAELEAGLVAREDADERQAIAEETSAPLAARIA